MASSPTFSNKSRNLLGFIKWNSPIFNRNHQALLLTIWFNFNVLSFLGIGSNGLLSCPPALRKNWGQLPVQLFPINLEISLVLSNETFLYRSAWWFLINIREFHLIKTHGFVNLVGKVGLPAIQLFPVIWRPWLAVEQAITAAQRQNIVVNRSVWWFLINIGEFHLVKPNRFLDL